MQYVQGMRRRSVIPGPERKLRGLRPREIRILLVSSKLILSSIDMVARHKDKPKPRSLWAIPMWLTKLIFRSSNLRIWSFEWKQVMISNSTVWPNHDSFCDYAISKYINNALSRDTMMTEGRIQDAVRFLVHFMRGVHNCQCQNRCVSSLPCQLPCAKVLDRRE